MSVRKKAFQSIGRTVRRESKAIFLALFALKKSFSLAAGLGVVIALILFPLGVSAQAEADTPTPPGEPLAASETTAPSETPAAADTSTLPPSKTPKPSKTPRPPPTETPLPTLGPALPEVESLPGDYAPDEVIVKMSASASRSQRKNLLAYGDVSDTTPQDLGVMVLKVPEGSVSQTIAALEQLPGVEYAEPNYYTYAQDVIPNDPGWSLQWGLPEYPRPAGLGAAPRLGQYYHCHPQFGGRPGAARPGGQAGEWL